MTLPGFLLMAFYMACSWAFHPISQSLLLMVFHLNMHMHVTNVYHALKKFIAFVLPENSDLEMNQCIHLTTRGWYTVSYYGYLWCINILYGYWSLQHQHMTYYPFMDKCGIDAVRCIITSYVLHYTIDLWHIGMTCEVKLSTSGISLVTS